MLADLMKELSGEFFDENVYKLGYNLGKWIYLIDAIDDFEKDIKKKNFNVFINCYTDCMTKEQLIKQNSSDIINIFGEVLANVEQANRQIKYRFNHDLLDNILLLGIKEQTKQVLENKKCKKNTTKS